jgi:hypothetical protein
MDRFRRAQGKGSGPEPVGIEGAARAEMNANEHLVSFPAPGLPLRSMPLAQAEGRGDAARTKQHNALYMKY